MISVAKKLFFEIVLVSFFSMVNTGPLWAAGPAERIRYTTNRILAVAADPALNSSDKREERRFLIRNAVDERFDWGEISKRCLGKHWKELSEEEQDEFIILFSKLLERAYLEKVENFSGEKVSYEKEVIDGAYGSVESKIMTGRGTPVHVKYHLIRKKNDWLVYDVSIGGVSLVNTYRNQFSNILRNSSYKKLAEKMKDKVAEK